MNTAQMAVGRWPSILGRFGVNAEFLQGKHTSCPHCGGKDRFRFANTQGRGEFFCNQCAPSGGDGFDLVQKVMGWDFKQASKEIEKLIPNVKPMPVPPKQSIEDKRKKLNNMRKRVRSITESPDVVSYLNNRGISNETIDAIMPTLGCIRGFEYWSNGKAKRFDSMIGKVQKCGKPITYHVTYCHEGSKAPVSVARKIMPTIDKFSHGVVQIFDHSHELGVAEGIETAISCYEVFGIPTWAALTAKSLENFVIPAGVTKLYVFGDNDAGQMTGQRSARKLVERAKFQGLEVVECIPTVSGFDWNDVLLSEKGK